MLSSKHMDELAATHKFRKYRSRAEQDAGMKVMIRNGGSPTAAGRELGIPAATCNSWRKEHPDRYLELQRELGPELEAQAVAGFQAFVLRAEAAKSKVLDRFLGDLEADAADWQSYAEAVQAGKDPKPPAPRVKDAAKSLQAISISQGIGVQKVLELTGRPTHIVETRSLSEAMARLRELGAEAIDGTATEEPAMLPEATAAAPVAALPMEATEHNGTRNDHEAGPVG